MMNFRPRNESYPLKYKITSVAHPLLAVCVQGLPSPAQLVQATISLGPLASRRFSPCKDINLTFLFKLENKIKTNWYSELHSSNILKININTCKVLIQWVTVPVEKKNSESACYTIAVILLVSCDPHTSRKLTSCPSSMLSTVVSTGWFAFCLCLGGFIGLSDSRHTFSSFGAVKVLLVIGGWEVDGCTALLSADIAT